MRKHLNNHFGYSRIFKHARFAVEPEANKPDADNGLPDIDVSAGGSEETKDEVDDGESLESIKVELARAKAETERYKNSINKLTKTNKELTEKTRSLMTADQLEKEAQDARDKRFAEMEKELRTNKYSKRLVGIGMVEAEADAFANTMPELEDAETFFTTLGNFIKAREKASADKAIQDLLKSRPDINAGNGDSDKDDPAMAYAKASVARNKGSNVGASQDILKNFM